MPIYSPKQQMIAQRRVARRLAMIAIYQWQLTGNGFLELYKNFQDDKSFSADLHKADKNYFKSVTQAVLNHTEKLDECLNRYLDRPIEQVDDIERAILRLASCELLDRSDVPYKVIVNESINLAKKFGGEQAHRYINGVLDKVANDIRNSEVLNS